MNSLRPVRVLHITGDIYRYNGAANQARILASALEVLGCRNYFVAHTGLFRRVGETGGMRVFNAGYGKISSFLGTLVCLCLTRPDVAHSHGFFVGAIAACHLLRVPVILKTTLRGVDDYESLSRAGRLQFWIARQVKMNNALAEYLAAINRRYIDTKRVVVIPNGVRLPLSPIRDKAMPPILVVVGAVVKRKRIDLAITFFNKLGSSNSDLVLEVIGPLVDLDYYRYCVSLISPAVVDRVHFVGEISHLALERRLSQASSLIFASEREGFPNAIIEAMAHNCLPIIVGSDPGAREAICQHGGIVVDGDEEIEWNTVQAAIEKSVAYSTAKAHYDIKETAMKHLDIYRSMGSTGKAYS